MVKKKYLWTNNRGYTYVRRNGTLIPIRATKGTAEFDSEYWAIMRGDSLVSTRSFNGLIASYRVSSRWTKLSARTRDDYENVLNVLTEKIGTMDCRRMVRADVIKAREGHKNRPRFATYVVQVLSILMEHAIDIGWRKDNPAKGVGKVKTDADKTKPHLPWTDDAVAVFRSGAAPLPLLIFELGLGSVQRPADCTKFRWEDYDGRCLRIEQGKTKVHLTLPCTERLRAILDKQERISETILVNRRGAPLAYQTMAQIMLKERRRLGVEAFDLHALRYRGVMELALAGCTDDEIASYSGHASKEMIRHYAGKARQETAARRALEKREADDRR
ncbi:tyrosine-type recombinase/integrase [Jannaschia formosa]|uniref:tyrosine-type recombinase/integrase n=1 Tax=Jannaschia formosa TaxID=2259592 RepID=UPI000E1BC878|nr:tyrosine-type recombinase/integrase [Jannaschia formosa]TFL16231.1 integrase [Jannaschia formosa]